MKAHVADVKRGARMAAIANLDRDIAHTLSAITVRIEAPVPGENVVGIEDNIPARIVFAVAS